MSRRTSISPTSVHADGRGQALYETAQVQGKGRRRAPDQHPPPRPRTSQTTRHEAIRKHGRRRSTRNTTTTIQSEHRGSADAAIWCSLCALTNQLRSVRLCRWYSRPRQCGEVALPERAMIRGTEGYHPHGRMQAKTPVNAGPQPLPGTPTRGSHRAVPPARSGIRHARALAQARLNEVWFGSLPAALTARGSGYLPESPFRAAPYSGLSQQKSPVNQPLPGQ